MHSEDYAKQLKETHAGRRPEKKWGTTGARNFGDEVIKFIEHRRGFIHSVLDFGAGQQTLGQYVLKNAVDIRVNWTDFDPGIPALENNAPDDGMWDMIVSSDVMEHVEPEMVDATIEWQKAHARKAMMHFVACSECGMTLPDGRNAHLTVEEPKWWWDKYADSQWKIVFASDCVQLRRGKLAPHAVIMLEKEGS